MAKKQPPFYTTDDHQLALYLYLRSGWSMIYISIATLCLFAILQYIYILFGNREAIDFGFILRVIYTFPFILSYIFIYIFHIIHYSASTRKSNMRWTQMSKDKPYHQAIVNYIRIIHRILLVVRVPLIMSTPLIFYLWEYFKENEAILSILKSNTTVWFLMIAIIALFLYGNKTRKKAIEAVYPFVNKKLQTEQKQ